MPTGTSAQADERHEAAGPRASVEDEKPRTIPATLLRRIAATPAREAFEFPDGSGWKALTWSEVGERVRAIAVGLRSLGLQDEERCAILSGTRIEWILVDLGVLAAGGATTTIYPASTAEE